MFLEGCASKVWVASTCSTSDVPMPNASEPNAPWVEVWLSPQTGGAGQGPALFRADDVHDALTNIVHREILDAEFAGVLFQGLDLLARFRIGDAFVAILGRHIVIGDRQGQFRAADLAARVAQAFKGLGAGHFVHQMAVDIENGGFTRLVRHQMGVPDLVVQCLGHDHYSLKFNCATSAAAGLHIRGKSPVQRRQRQDRYPCI
jgi:hypothetical protein